MLLQKMLLVNIPIKLKQKVKITNQIYTYLFFFELFKNQFIWWTIPLKTFISCIDVFALKIKFLNLLIFALEVCFKRYPTRKSISSISINVSCTSFDDAKLKTFNIPTSQNNPSLNLSHAVSIALYELNKCSKRNFDQELKVFNLASSKQIHDSFLEIEELLLKVGYLLKHTSVAKISKFKNFILRANTSMHEINVLRGIVHQINWFLNNSKKK